MKLHEYQGKELFARHGVAVTEGAPCESVTEARRIAEGLPGPLYVVKCQIHAGGRGKGTLYADAAMQEEVLRGGVKLARSLDEVEELAGKMLGNFLQTKQTGDGCKQVKRLYIQQGYDIADELYCAVLLDRAVSKPLLMVSSQGGMDIEEVAEQSPEQIHKLHVDPFQGLHPFQARRLAKAIGLVGTPARAFVELARQLVDCFLAIDAEMVEVNPLAVTEAGEVLVLDAKVSVDDNALFRHGDIAGMRDPSEEDPAELEAGEHGMAFVKLDGNIGCLVNGAGLAMATMDAIAAYGAEQGAFPANFLDVGGGADAAKVQAAFKLILRDEHVEAILVNIFGGIMKCDVIAEGVLAAVREMGLDRPLVVRLEGTNVEQGKKLIAESGLDVIAADDLRDGCVKAAEAAVAYRAKKGEG